MIIAGLDSKVRSIRAVKKLSGEQLGKMVGVQKSTISAYENGTSSPGTDSIKSLANALGVSTDYLLNNDDYASVSVQGLEQEQVEIVCAVIEGFRKANSKL